MKINVFGLRLLPPEARKAGALIRACELTLAGEGVSQDGELNIIVVDRKKMLEINKAFLNHTHDTDVIAFNYEPEAGQDPDEDAPFGDIYISAYKTRQQAEELGHSALDEALTLVVHGTLHLLGYDDATPRQKNAMFKKQDDLVARVKARS